MIKLSKTKLFCSIIFTILAFFYAMPNFVKIDNNSIFPNKSVNLGLDLRGGSHLLLMVDFNKYLGDQLERLGDSLRKEFRKEKLGYKNLLIDHDNISFDLRNMEDFESIRKVIRSVERYSIIKSDHNKVTIKYDDARINELRDNVFEQSIEIIRMRVDSSGTKEPIIQKQGSDYILLQVPGDDNPEYLKSILGQTAKLSFHLVDEEISAHITKDSSARHEDIILSGKYENGIEYTLALKKKALITGDMLTNAQATFNQEGKPAVDFVLNHIGAKLFAEATKNGRGRRLAIVMDNKILSAPSINEPILTGKGIISGSFTLESAQELALMLRAGALPAPLNIEEERSIGPNLGADSVESGKKAGIIGFCGVVVFMFWSYGIFGFFASIALSLAMLYILALLSLFQATLTLPGIAGIILTIGMAVDANVLIYERIREELRKKASNLYAIKQGFDTAFVTIADSNITTLIAALLLYIFGTGAVRGFAVSLSIGIVSSMFTAIVVTKLLIDIWMKYAKPKSLGIE